MNRSTKIGLLVLLVLLLDQGLKIWVKTHLTYGQEMQLFGLHWALIHFVENNGMAFGLTLGGGEYGKLLLSIFRLLAITFLVFYLRSLIRVGAPMGLLVSFAFILAGATGNIIDSAFYGLIFSESLFHGAPAQLFPAGGGYAGFLHGKVVDMFYFPVFRGQLPDWIPFWGGDYILFFKPVFNVADIAITLGVINILLFQRSFFQTPEHRREPTGESPLTSDDEGLTEEKDKANNPLITGSSQ